MKFKIERANIIKYFNPVCEILAIASLTMFIYFTFTHNFYALHMGLLTIIVRQLKIEEKLIIEMSTNEEE